MKFRETHYFDDSRYSEATIEALVEYARRKTVNQLAEMLMEKADIEIRPLDKTITISVDI